MRTSYCQYGSRTCYMADHTLYVETIHSKKTPTHFYSVLLNIGFTSVYQLGRAGQGNGGCGKPIIYNLNTENHLSDSY